MPQTDPIQGATFLPLWNEPYQIPDNLNAMYQFLLARGVPRFATTAARDAAIPSPVAGMKCWVDADAAEQVYAGGAWATAFTPDVVGTVTPSAIVTAVAYATCSRSGSWVEINAQFTAPIPSGTITTVVDPGGVPAQFRPSAANHWGVAYCFGGGFTPGGAVVDSSGQIRVLQSSGAARSGTQLTIVFKP